VNVVEEVTARGATLEVRVLKLLVGIAIVSGAKSDSHDVDLTSLRPGMVVAKNGDDSPGFMGSGDNDRGISSSSLSSDSSCSAIGGLCLLVKYPSSDSSGIVWEFCETSPCSSVLRLLKFEDFRR